MFSFGCISFLLMTRKVFFRSWSFILLTIILFWRGIIVFFIVARPSHMLVI